MNVQVQTVDGERHRWIEADASFDTTVLQVTYERCVTTFPLCNVLSFSIDSDPS